VKWVVDPEDPLYAECFGTMIRELGKRYDGHPDLEGVDLSFIGWAGEGGGRIAWVTLDSGQMNKMAGPICMIIIHRPLTIITCRMPGRKPT